MKKSLSFILVGLAVLFFVVVLFIWLAPDALMPKMANAYTQQTLDKEAAAEARLKNIEARIAALESKCAIGTTGDLSQRVIALENESAKQGGLLNIIFELLVKLKGLLVNLLDKLVR